MVDTCICYYYSSTDKNNKQIRMVQESWSVGINVCSLSCLSMKLLSPFSGINYLVFSKIIFLGFISNGTLQAHEMISFILLYTPQNFVEYQFQDLIMYG